jgi:hypothetical protein
MNASHRIRILSSGVFARVLAGAATVVLAISLSAHAHDCSGGPDGGSDATGNQCNDAATIVAPSAISAIAAGAGSPSAPATKAAPAASKSARAAAKRGASTTGSTAPTLARATVKTPSLQQP